MRAFPACAIGNIVDEYVRRRAGRKSQLPDHPVMVLKAWGVPDTYRMLIFKEQIEALLAEVTGFSQGYCRLICRDITEGKLQSSSRPSQQVLSYVLRHTPCAAESRLMQMGG